MEKKKKSALLSRILLFFIVLFVFLLILIVIFLTKKTKVSWLNDDNYLYKNAIDYISPILISENSDKNQEDFQLFTDYQGFGIEQKNGSKFVYMWILEESYFVRDNELVHSSGSSMLYKFEVIDSDIIGYENPKDGEQYASSVRDMLPRSIEDIVLNFEMKTDKVKLYVDTHYSYLPAYNN